MKKENKKDIKKTENLSRGISTKGYSPARSRILPRDDVKPEKKPLSPKAKKTILASVAGVLLIAIVWLAVYVVFTIRDNNFDYLEYDLKKYVETTSDQYKNYSLDINIAKPHLKNADGSGVSDVETEYLAMIATDNCGYSIDDGATLADGTIAPGDEVYVWYRGYIIDSDGKEQEVTSLTNFYQTQDKIIGASNRLYVGLNQFPLKGFEAGLVGKNTLDYAKFKKITDRTVAAGDVVYVSCERYQEGKTKEDGEIGYCVRIDLNDPDTASIWQPILEGKAIGNINDFDVTLDGTLYHYYNTSILFVTTCENSTDKPVLTVETYAPYDYSVQILQNETVYFDVYVERIERHNPWHKDESVGAYEISMDWNDEYIENKLTANLLSLTREQLMEYEGASLTEKYESFIYSDLMDKYEQELRVMVEDAIWNYYLGNIKIKRYPKSRVKEIYKEYYSDIETQFKSNGGRIYDMYSGKNVTCTDINQFGILYLGLQYSENQNLKSVLTETAQSLVAERLILYYIMKEENLTPTAQQLADKVAEIKDEYLEEFIRQEGTDTSSYTEEQYNTYVENCKNALFGYYDDAYFTESAYYDIVLETMLKYPTLKTYDERSAYPEE